MAMDIMRGVRSAVDNHIHQLISDRASSPAGKAQAKLYEDLEDKARLNRRRDYRKKLFLNKISKSLIDDGFEIISQQVFSLNNKTKGRIYFKKPHIKMTFMLLVKNKKDLSIFHKSSDTGLYYFETPVGVYPSEKKELSILNDSVLDIPNDNHKVHSKFNCSLLPMQSVTVLLANSYSDDIRTLVNSKIPPSSYKIV